MASRPKFTVEAGDGEELGFNFKLEAYVDSSDHGVLVILRVGELRMMLIDNDSWHTPVKFYSDQQARSKMVSIIEDITSINSTVDFYNELVNTVGSIEVNMLWISMIINKNKFLLVDKDERSFRFLFFKNKESVDIITADIVRNLGGALVGTKPAEQAN